MREILFRGKSKLTGLFLEGNLLIDQDGETYIVWFNCHKKECRTSVYPDTIGQYTGLTDKNGVRIFEGDIVKGTCHKTDSYLSKLVPFDVIGVVEYDEKYQAPVVRMGGLRLHIEVTIKGEVIGNIHDNPELLKGGEE